MCFNPNGANSGQYDLEAGVEIGLGWLVSQPITTLGVPAEYARLTNLDRTMSSQ